METPLSHGPTWMHRVFEFVVDFFWILVIAFVALYAFLFVLGGFSLVEAGGASLVVASAAVLLGVHFWRQHRHHDEIVHDPRIQSARERRGF